MIIPARRCGPELTRIENSVRMKITPLHMLPCRGQSSEQVFHWFEREKPKRGDVVVVRVVYGGYCKYRPDTIKEVDHGRQRRVILTQHGSFYRNGKNCFHPTGQTRMIEPTKAVLEAIESRKVCWCHHHIP